MILSRRSLLAGSAASTLAPPASHCALAAGGRFSIGAFGGIFDTALTAMQAPFLAASGLEMDKTAATSQVILTKLLASRDRSPFDTVMMTAEAQLLAHHRGLLTPVSEKSLPGLSAVQKRLLAPFQADGGYAAVPVHWKTIGILWRRDLAPFEITSWQDLWRPELKNRISVQNMPTLGASLMLIAAAIVHGGSQKNLEPGWRAMAALRPNIRDFYAITSNALASLVAGDTWVSVNTLDLGLPLASKGVVATIPSEGVTYSPEGLGFPKNAANPDGGLRFAEFMLQPAQQVAWCSLAKVAPSTGIAVPEAAQKELVETEAVLSKLMDIDFLDMGLNIQKWADRWRQEVVG